MKLFYKKVSTLTLVGVSQREARETAQRFSRPVAHQEGGFPEPSPPPTGGHSRLPARSSAERCPLGTSAPQRGRRDLVLRKQLVAHILGSPLGGAVAVRRLRGRVVSAPHLSVSPRRRLYQRAAHAWGGVTGKLGGNLRGIEDAIKKPPARVSYGKQSTGLFSYFPALADATKTLGALPPIPPPPLKRWTKLLPAYGAHVRWPLPF